MRLVHFGLERRPTLKKIVSGRKKNPCGFTGIKASEGGGGNGLELSEND